MFHPFFKAVLQRPDLLVQHLSNHAVLIKAEAAATGRSLAMKAVAALLAGFLLLLALALTGVAVMLGYMQSFHPALVAVPAVAWALALLSLAIALRRSAAAKAQREVMSEIEADLAALRNVKGEQDERERQSTGNASPVGAFARSTSGADGLQESRGTGGLPTSGADPRSATGTRDGAVTRPPRRAEMVDAATSP